MHNLSVIKEKETMELIKKNNADTMDSSGDSGLASSSSDGLQQGMTTPSGKLECPIIEFTALNLAARESTFLNGRKNSLGKCNLSAIMPDKNRETINSVDCKAPSIYLIS